MFHFLKLRSLFEDRLFYKSLFTISVPIMLQSLINASMNFLDTMMVGRLGITEIAGVGLVNQFFYLYTLVLFGIVSGASVFTAQFWGKRDIQGIRRNTGFCLILTICTGSIFTLAAFLLPEQIVGVYSRDPAVIAVGGLYLKTLAPAFLPYAVGYVFILTLRSVEKVRLALISTLIAVSLNAILNYLLIFGIGPFPVLGVAGAARATAIARTVEALILVTVSYVRRYPPAGSLRELLGFRLPYVKRFVRITLPVVIEEIIWVTGISAHSLILARTHTDAIAAYNITSTVFQLTWVVFTGLGNGVGVLIGKKIGEGNETLAREYASRIIRFSPLLSVAVMVLLYSISLPIPLIFNVNDSVLSMVRHMLIILSCIYPFRAFNMAAIVGICRPGGDTVFCFIVDVVFMWTVALPAAALASFVFHSPVWLIYIFLASDEPLKALLGFWRYRSGKWLRNVTRGI